MNKKSRNLGSNYALAWKTGEQTHMTIVYLNNVKRGYEQDRLKKLVEEYLDSVNFPATLELVFGEMTTERCVGVLNIEIKTLQDGLRNHLITLGYDLRDLCTPHIDLRGLELTQCVNTTVDTRSWNY